MRITSFCECSNPYESANIVLMGIPLDSTASFRPGSRFAPAAVRDASFEFEDYEFLTGENIQKVPFCDVGDIAVPGSLNESLDSIYKDVKVYIDDGMIPVSIGGEHLATLPIIQALITKHKMLNIVVFDAHLDLKDTYLKAKYSHATVMRRILELNETSEICFFGIRSSTFEEKMMLDNHPRLFYEDISHLRKDVPVYISIDMDVLDPSVAPGVGNPEPGGWSYPRLYSMLQKLKDFSIAGADVVEISPHYDLSAITAITGAKIVRDLLFLINRQI
ncbi:MAG TPA: agmatinase [Thermodesulfovibrionia bacterium]|nr:agmatinase [Thermodesulfovibrionia bacterium]